jgi:hypothetical protein
MKTYEAWITPGASAMSVRVVVIEAKDEREAYAKAKALCFVGEFVRGVQEVEA